MMFIRSTLFSCAIIALSAINIPTAMAQWNDSSNVYSSNGNSAADNYARQQESIQGAYIMFMQQDNATQKRQLDGARGSVSAWDKLADDMWSAYMEASCCRSFWSCYCCCGVCCLSWSTEQAIVVKLKERGTQLGLASKTDAIYDAVGAKGGAALKWCAENKAVFITGCCLLFVAIAMGLAMLGRKRRAEREMEITTTDCDEM